MKNLPSTRIASIHYPDQSLRQRCLWCHLPVGCVPITTVHFAINIWGQHYKIITTSAFAVQHRCVHRVQLIEILLCGSFISWRASLRRRISLGGKHLVLKFACRQENRHGKLLIIRQLYCALAFTKSICKNPDVQSRSGFVLNR